MTASHVRSTLGYLFSRIITPLWLFTGATFKLWFDMPRALPRTIWEPAHQAGVDLQVLLHTLIGIEYVLVGVLLFSARWARPLAIALLSFFCLILINEWRQGSSSCGCLGKISTPPEIMLIIDGAILLGVLFFKPPAPAPRSEDRAAPSLRPWIAGAALVWLVASFAASFGVSKAMTNGSSGREDPDGPIAVVPTVGSTEDEPEDGQGTTEAADETNEDAGAGPAPVISRQPPQYYVFEPESWIGKHWNELDIASYISAQPEQVDQGRRYVVFFNPTCDHCYEILLEHFEGEPVIPTTVVAIPEWKSRFETEGVYDMPCDGCQRAQLKFGCDWIVEPPVIVALEDGYVVCAAEEKDIIEPTCKLWH